MLIDFSIRLKNYTKEELLDIYWNIADNVWDRRIGRKPSGFDSLPDKPTRFKKRSKSGILELYIQEIEKQTTQKERRRYLNVVIQKCMTDTEFEEFWESLEHSH